MQMKTVAEVYLVRHGETEWNRSGRLQGQEDIPLNENGVLQARRLAPFFQGIGIGVIVTSPLMRAFRTARIIGEYLGNVPIKQYDDLMERDFGQASGLTREQVRSKFPEGMPAAGQESDDNLRARTQGVFDRIMVENGDEPMIIVSHGNLLNFLIAHLSDRQFGTGKFKLANCSVSKIVREENAWQFEFINQAVKD